MERVQELALVLVDALHLAVEAACRGRGRSRSAWRAAVGQHRLVHALEGRPLARGRSRPRPGAPAARSSSRFVVQPSPMASVISAARPGLACSSQRRGVMPFVLLLMRPGSSAVEVGERRLLEDARVCSAATPFTEWLPDERRGAPSARGRRSSRMAVRRTCSPSSPGSAATTDRKRRSISSMISKWRGSRRCSSSRRPRLEGLGQDRVVRVAEDRLGQLPGRLPVDPARRPRAPASARGWRGPGACR